MTSEHCAHLRCADFLAPPSSLPVESDRVAAAEPVVTAARAGAAIGLITKAVVVVTGERLGDGGVTGTKGATGEAGAANDCGANRAGELGTNGEEGGIRVEEGPGDAADTGV